MISSKRLLKLKKLSRKGCFLFLLLCIVENVHSQQTWNVTTTTSYTANNGNGIATFNFENTNAYPIIIDSVFAESTYSGDCTFYLWYNLTPINGQPAGAIPTTTGWIAADTEVVNIASTNTQQAVMTDVGLVIPPNTTVGIAVGGFNGVNSTTSGAMRYYTLSAGSGNTTFSAGGCNIITGDDVSYGSTSYTSTSYNYPRGFVGSIVFEKQGVPDNAGIDSILNPNPDTSFCSGVQEVLVRLRNFGLNTLDSVKIYWELDGQMYGPINYTTPVDSMSSPDNWAIISLGNIDFPYSVTKHLKVWTSLPNGVGDNQVENDTLDVYITPDMQNVTVEITPGDTAICRGSSMILDAGQQPSGSIFIWSNGAVTRQTSVSQPDSYSVIVQSSQGCFAYDTVVITQNPQPIAGDFGIVDEGGNDFKFTPVNMQNVTNYHWDFGDGDTLNVSTDAPQTHHYAQTGTYAVSLTVSNVCGAIPINKQVYVQPPMGIGELTDVAKVLKVYPNPANDKLNIRTQVANIQLESVSIYNMLGKRVFVQNLKGAAVQLSLAQFPTGIYQVRIQTTKGFANSKIEIVR